MKDYPEFANVMKEKMPDHGIYQGGWPKGAVVHYTAGHDGAEKTILGGIKNGYTYWCIQRDGKLFCAHPANKWGYHAGKSAWSSLQGSTSDDLLGIEINSAGKVDPLPDGTFKTYWGGILPASEVRYTSGKDNQAKGYYHKYTEAQEETLIKTLLWLKSQAPDLFSFDLVLGHDEVSGPKGIGVWRKVDPGAALSMTMSEFRDILKQRYAAGAPSIPNTPEKPTIPTGPEIVFSKESVRSLQVSINSMGYRPKLTEDGIVGPKTKNALLEVAGKIR